MANLLYLLKADFWALNKQEKAKTERPATERLAPAKQNVHRRGVRFPGLGRRIKHAIFKFD